jgi:hypothetical protein
MVFFGKNDIAFGTVIEVFGIERFIKHNNVLFHPFNGAADGFCFLNFWQFVF